jgi:CRP-like cAMP-binding protein
VLSPVLFDAQDAAAGFLASLHDEEVAFILGYTQPRRYAAGEVAVRAHERDRSLYVITRGEFNVWLPTPSGPLAVNRLSSGDMFGELAFFDNQPRSADVQAATAAEVLVMTPAAFERMRLADPRLALCFALDLGRVLSIRFRRQDDRLAALGQAAQLSPPL